MASEHSRGAIGAAEANVEDAVDKVTATRPRQGRGKTAKAKGGPRKGRGRGRRTAGFSMLTFAASMVGAIALILVAGAVGSSRH